MKSDKLFLFKTKKGVSLIELLTTIGLISVVSLLLVTLIAKGFQSYRFSREMIETQDQIAMVMRDFERKIRGATSVIRSDPAALTVLVYLPKDAYPAPSQIRYFIEDNALKRGQIAPSGTEPIYTYPTENESVKTIAENITNGSHIFDYYNDASVLIEDPVPADAVRMIKITVTADKDTTQKPEALTEITTVSLRNLKINL